MPKYPVSVEIEQDALFEHRHLLPPADAAALLGITRQAVEKSGSRPGGQLLIWSFETEGGNRRYRPLYVDLGPHSGQHDPSAWRRDRDDLHGIIRRALQAATEPIPGAVSAASPKVEQQAATDRRPSPDEEDSLIIVHLVATGLMEFGRQLRRDPSRFVPYPDALQKGLDKLTVHCLRREIPPPASVPDLLTWCRDRPLRTWPLSLNPDIAGPSDHLLIGAQPTAFCQEWAIGSRDVESEVIERRLLHAVIASCRQANDQRGYVTFRRLLIEKPVLTTLQLHMECARPELSRLADQVRAVYAPAPLEYAESGTVTCCATCGNLLLPTSGGGLRCGDDRCARQPTMLGRRVALTDDPLWLELPFRTFVAAPGRAELRLAERLERLGVGVNLWPAFDAYDLQVTFLDRETWAVDVKDWASPAALARHLDQLPSLFREHPPWQRAFLVFPQERLHQRSDFVRAFTHACRALARSVEIDALEETAFVDTVRRHLRAVAGVH